MRSALGRIGVAAVAAALLTSCSGGDGGDATKEPEGLAAAEVCRGFAKDAAVTAALKTATDSERFHDGLSASQPDKALDLLRDATRAPLSDSYRPQPRPYCKIWRVGDIDKDLKIELSPASKAPGMDPELLKKVTLYTSGALAYSSSGLGNVYFSCDLKEPAHDFVVETTIWGPAGIPDADLEQRTRLITLANAAARQVSAELGCQGDELATGVPKAIPATSSAPSS
ncbi:hypothetical protein OG259_25910 [Streptomyces sp. NBC_00250]|uniref:hypothetical protein n=1 Tax=Streptomyces sp. NBC_00250 TaxID=2903641 RepID=UPI002E2BBF45|nr:hypothetical protein [Streptomyces sp. NBC_00250]